VIAHKGFKHATGCKTKKIKLMGGEGYHELLHVQLVQKYGISIEMAQHLCNTYGSCAFAVCELSRSTGATYGVHRFGKPLVAGFPYMEAEIEYACKHEMAMTVKDMLTLRMRLAYINSEAAKQAIPRVAELMAQHLKWDKKEKERQIKDAKQYIGYFGGPVANKANAKMRQATVTDLHEVFAELDKPGSGYMDIDGLNTASIKLGFPFRNNAELKEKFAEIDINGKGRITELEFTEWWNKATPATKRLQKQLSLTAASEVALDKTLFESEKEDATPKK